MNLLKKEIKFKPPQSMRVPITSFTLTLSEPFPIVAEDEDDFNRQVDEIKAANPGITDIVISHYLVGAVVLMKTSESTN